MATEQTTKRKKEAEQPRRPTSPNPQNRMLPPKRYLSAPTSNAFMTTVAMRSRATGSIGRR